MTELSPSAQAVLEAVTLKKYNLPLERVPEVLVKKWSLAISVALHAAVDQAEPDDGISTEVRQVINKIHAIAEELEAQ